MTPVITFASDFGLVDSFVGVCHAVMAHIAPPARVIDLTHGIARGDVGAGAVVLEDTAAYLPAGVVVAVVDPGVGTNRRAVALAAGEQVLVGPDNGLLMPAADRLGGATAAVALESPAYRKRPESATFHGRDVFAPAAAHLATGVPLSALGPPLDPGELLRLPTPAAEVHPGLLRSEVVAVDRFGNCALGLGPEALQAAGLSQGQRVEVAVGDRAQEGWLVTTFGHVAPGDLAVFVDSSWRVAVAVNGDSAAEQLPAERGTLLEIRAG